MFVATNRLRIKKGHGAELEEMFRKRGGVEKQPGFAGFELWRLEQEGEEEEYLVVSRWESREAHHDWTRSDAFRQAHAGPHPDFLLGPGEFRSYEVRLASGPQGSKG